MGPCIQQSMEIIPKPKVPVAHLNVRSLKTGEHLIQVRNLMDENITEDLMRLAVGCAHTCTRP